jgi:tetratricopeptide (TPR) repeat protein
MAIAVSERCDKDSESYALKQLAELYRALGNFEEARHYCQQALALTTELGIP